MCITEVMSVTQAVYTAMQKIMQPLLLQNVYVISA